MMDVKGRIKFNRSAFKHEVTMADILSAFETYILKILLKERTTSFC